MTCYFQQTKESRFSGSTPFLGLLNFSSNTILSTRYVLNTPITRRIAQRRLLVLLVSITKGNNAHHEIALRVADQITNVTTVETLHDARTETVGLAGEHEHLQREHGLLDAPFLDIRRGNDDDSV